MTGCQRTFLLQDIRSVRIIVQGGRTVRAGGEIDCEHREIGKHWPMYHSWVTASPYSFTLSNRTASPIPLNNADFVETGKDSLISWFHEKKELTES